jgi:hypothetical protein
VLRSFTESEKVPSAADVVPIWEPATLIDTPDKGEPSESDTFPFTTVCANTIGNAKSKQHMNSVSFLMQLIFGLKYDDFLLANITIYSLFILEQVKKNPFNACTK